MNGLFVAVSLMDEQLLTPNGKPPSHALSLKKYSIIAVGPLKQLFLFFFAESRKLCEILNTRRREWAYPPGPQSQAHKQPS